MPALNMLLQHDCTKFKIIVLVIATLTGMLGCAPDLDEKYSFLPLDVRSALLKLDQHQRDEMLNLIDGYVIQSGDSLKLHAAYFLIKELPDQYYYNSEQLQKFDTLFDIIAAKPVSWRKNVPWYGKQIDEIFDTLESKYGECCDLQVVKDQDVLTAEMLRQNIDLAFSSWKQPWSRHYNFDQFCEYILPYRSRNEALESWRPKYAAKYGYMIKKLKDSTNVIELAKFINDSAQLQYQAGISRYPVMVSPTNLLKTSFADCFSIANHKIFAMRSMGIAASVDFVPLWGNGYNGHYWNTLFDSVGRPKNFMVALNDVQAQTAYNWTLSKVYRFTYSANPEIKELLNRTDRDCPSFFHDPYFIDVTNEYVNVSTLTIKLQNNPEFSDHEYVYLCQFNRGWVAVDFARIKDNTAAFDNVGGNMVYNIMYYEQGRFHAASPPIIVDKEGRRHEIENKPGVQTVRMNRKCHMEVRKENWLKSLIGGEIQASNDSTFHSYVTLHTIGQKPTQYMHKVNLDIMEKFQYVRFSFSTAEQKILYWGDGASIAELGFWDEYGKKLTGKPFGTPGKLFNGYTPQKAFDGNALSFFEDSREGVHKFVGLKLDKASIIKSVSYQARNDLNNIQIGDEYELRYYNGQKFVSLGRKKATDTLLVYDNAPLDALFWLKNHSHGTEERIFTYENDHQIWW